MNSCLIQIKCWFCQPPGYIEQVFEQFEEAQSPGMCPYFIQEGDMMEDGETSAQYDLVFVEEK